MPADLDLSEHRTLDIIELKDKTILILESDNGVNHAQLHDVVIALKKYRYKVKKHKIETKDFDVEEW